MKRSSSSSEPDLVSGDGVYSRYLTMYPGVGTYSVAIITSDNQVSLLRPHSVAINSVQSILVNYGKSIPPYLSARIKIVLEFGAQEFCIDCTFG